MSLYIGNKPEKSLQDQIIGKTDELNHYETVDVCYKNSFKPVDVFIYQLTRWTGVAGKLVHSCLT